MNLKTYKVYADEEEEIQLKKPELIEEKATQEVWVISRLDPYYPSVLLFTDQEKAEKEFKELTTGNWAGDSPYILSKAMVATEYLASDEKNISKEIENKTIENASIRWYI